MYTIVAFDGQQYGPVDRQTLQSWIVQGRVTATTLIKSAESLDGLPANQVPSLQPFFYSPPTYPQPMSYAIGLIQVPAGSHSVATAVILALLITGLGQMYNKQAMKGLVILLISVLLAFFTCGISIVITHPFALIDAILIAQRLDRGEAIRDWQCF